MNLMFIGDFLSDVFIGIIMVLDTAIYTLINSSYRIFMAIASARLLSSDVYYEIANRIYIIVGVLMLFVLSYAILKGIVNPDEAFKGDLGQGLVKRVLIAIFGLAIAPVLFNVLYQAQGLFLEQDVLGKVFFRIQNTEPVGVSGSVNASVNPDEQIKSIGGAVAATSIWQAFFYAADGYDPSEIKSDAKEYIGQAVGTGILCALGIAAGLIITYGSWGLGTVLGVGAATAACGYAVQDNINDANQLISDGHTEISLQEAYGHVAGGYDFDIFLIFRDNYFNDEIKYLWGVSTICGAFALYAFVSFSIDMGVRAAKLAYYQIIAPVPLVMQVLPKFKDSFDQYVKSVISTFMEVFIRISVVYIVTFVICHLPDLFSSFGTLWGDSQLTSVEQALALALLIIGLIAFARNAPDIICQSLKIDKGSMHLGIGKKLADGGVFAAGGIVGAGATSAVRNFRSAHDKAKKAEGFGGKFGAYARGVRSSLAGFGSAATRSAYHQFAHGGKGAQNWHEMRDHASRSARGADDAKQARDERLQELDAAKKDYAKLASDPNAKQEQLAQAYQRVVAATAMGAAMDKTVKAIDAWSTATVSTAAEDAQIKFMGSLDGLKDKLRDKTAKLGYVQAAMDYEKELNARTIERFDQAAYQSALNSYIAQNPNATEAQLTAERERLQKLYTMDEDTYRNQVTELSNLRTAAKKAREAAQDRGIVELAAKGDAGVLGILTPFFQENADFIAKNGAVRFKIDQAGNEMTLNDIITQNFGAKALRGSFDASEVFAGNNRFVVEDPQIKTEVLVTQKDGSQKLVIQPMKLSYSLDQSETSQTKGQFVAVNEDGKKVQLVQRTNASGQSYYVAEVMTDQDAVPNNNTKTYTHDNFFIDKIFNAIAGGGGTDAKTSTSVAGDAGKWAKAKIITSESYQGKVVRKRQIEEAKSGKK